MPFFCNKDIEPLFGSLKMRICNSDRKKNILKYIHKIKLRIVYGSSIKKRKNHSTNQYKLVKPNKIQYAAL